MTIFGRVNQENAEQLALATATLLFSLAAVALGPELADGRFLLRVAGAVIAAASLSTFFVLLRRFLNRIWARDLLGLWVYRTRPHEESKRSETGYGVAEFTQDANGGLQYRVDLYRRPDDALASSNGEAPSGESHGTATGLATSFNQRDGSLWILYRVEYYSDSEQDREGHLFVRAAGPAGHRVLRGSWASDLGGRELSAGVMTMVRPDDFPALVEADDREP